MLARNVKSQLVLTSLRQMPKCAITEMVPARMPILAIAPYLIRDPSASSQCVTKFLRQMKMFAVDTEIVHHPTTVHAKQVIQTLIVPHMLALVLPR